MENHVGMQKVGTLAEKGYSLVDLLRFKKYFNDRKIKTIIINLNHFTDKKTDHAYILIAKGGVKIACKEKDIYDEHNKLVPDKKYYDTRRSKVLNKLARWNLCFDEKKQDANYEDKKGTIVSYDSVPFTKKLRSKIRKMTNDDLKLEANYYYDINKTGIGFHSDCERRKVVGARFGKPHPFVFRWYERSVAIGDECRVMLGNGDMYIMSEKATGNDGKKRTIPILRHAAGCKKYTG